MDRLVRNAWRAFWVGLGASAVLVAQALVPASGPAPLAPDPAALPHGSEIGPLARPLRAEEPALSPAVSHASGAKLLKPGA